MKFIISFLFLVLLAQFSTQKSTLYVDTIEPNTDSVDIPYFNADNSEVIDASTGRFKLLPDSDVEITTEGPVYLYGSFISLDSDGQVSQTAEGSITLDATDAFVVITNDLNITAQNDVSLTTIAQELEINVGGSIEAVYDTANLTGASSVHLNSGGGEVEIFTDHTITNQASTTNIMGENRITMDALFDITLHAQNLIDSRANVIDFDTLGDFRITSTTANVQFQAGSELVVESFSSHFTAEEGVDIASLHGDIYVSSGRHILLSSLNTVDYEVTDDASFISNNGPITMNADISYFFAEEYFISDASHLTVSADTIQMSTINTNFDSHDGSIQVTTTSKTSYEAYDYIGFTSNLFNTTSFNLLISNTLGEQDVEFRSTEDQESYFSMISSETIKAGTDDFVGIYSGSIDTASNRIYMRAFLDLNISAEHKTFDFVSMKSEDIHFIAGRNELISANIGSIEASSSVTFSANQLLSINSSDSRGTTSFSASNQLNFTALATAVFGSTDDFTMNGWNLNFLGNGNSQFGSTVGNIDNYANDIFVNSLGSVSASAADGILFTSNDVNLDATNVIYTAPQYDFWANDNIYFDIDNSATFSVDGDLDFISFANMYIQFISNLNSPTIDFESQERIELNGDNIFASATSDLSIISAFRSDISWSGDTYTDDASHDSVWTAPISSYNSYGTVTWTTTGPISFTAEEEHTVDFFAYSDIIINTPSSDQYFGSATDYYLQINTKNTISSTKVTQYSADGDNYATLSGAVLFTTTSAFTATTTAGDLDFISDTDLTVTTGTWNVNVNNNGQIVTPGDILFDVTTNAVFNANTMSITSTAITADENGGVHIDGTKSIDITLTGQFSQNGGSVSFTSEDNTFYASDTLDINSIDSSTFTITGDLTFDANTLGSNIRFQSMDYNVISAGNIDFLGGDITLTSNRTQPIIFSTAGDTNILTDNRESFSWISRWDIEATMSNFTVRANHKDTKGNSISFTTTHDKGDFVAFSKSGWINFESRDSQTYNAEFIELFASGDLFFNTSLALSPNTGGITFLTDGYYHNPKVGDNTGITFTTTGPDGFIYLNAPIGGLTFYSGYDMSVHSFEGYIDALANQNMQFTSTFANLLISSNDELTFLADSGDMVFRTLNGSTELRAYSNITFSAATNIFLTSFETIQHTNGRSFEFSSNSGHIVILADSDSNVEYTAFGEFYIQSAETTSQYGNLGVYYNAFLGEYLASSKTGIKLMVENGDLNVNASESIVTRSANNWDIFVTSGQNLFWNALTKNIDVAAAENVTIRTERKNVLFQTEVGNIFMDSTGQIRFEADGTDDNPGGIGVDGAFVIAPNIDVYATDTVTVESEGHVTIGANTKPVVKIEAGGDAAASGVEFSAEGNVHFTIQEDVTITSGGNLYMSALKQFDMKTTGSISISTTGNDASGKDFTIRTPSELDVNAQRAYITGQEKASVASFQLISFITNGTDPNADAIKFISQNDFTIDVDGRADINGNTTAFTFENDYNFLILGDLAFTSAGEVAVYGDILVDLVADTFLTIKSTGNGSHINLNTFGTNSDLIIQTEDETSSIIFKTFGPLTYTSVDELEFDTTGPQVFVAYDNIADGVDNGDITITAAADIDLNGDSITLEGAKGITFTTINKADITLQSYGIMSVLARDDIVFDSNTGKMTISATAVLTFGSYEGNSADFAIQSTRDIYLTAYETYFEAGNDFSIDAGNTVDFTSHSDTSGHRYISFITEGADAQMTFDADTFTITSVLTYFNGGDIHMNTQGTTLFASHTTVLHTTGSHNHISYISEKDQLLITASNTITFQGFLDSTDEDYFHKGEGFLDWSSTGKNPTFGYGTLLNATQNAMTIFSLGNIGFLSNNFAMHSFDEITFTSSYGVDDQQYATTLLAKGTNGQMYFNSSTNLIIDSSDSIKITAATQINFFPYLSLTFAADGYSSDTADIGRGFSGLIASLHPNGDIYFNTTDFLTGVIAVTSNIIETYGERGLAFHLQDDDDTEFSGQFQITAPVISLNAKNSGLVQSIGGGDIVFDSTQTGGQIHLHAGDDIYFSVTNEFHIGDPGTHPDLFFDSRATLAYQSSNSDIDFTSLDGDHIIVYSDDFVMTSDGTVIQLSSDIFFSAGSEFAPSTEMRVISQVGPTIINAPYIHMNTQRNRYVDFVDGLIIHSVDNYFVDSYDGQQWYWPIANGSINNWLFYEEDQQYFCVGFASSFRCFACHNTIMYY